MDDEYNDLWELDRPVLVTIVTELRAEIEQAKREINARKGTQEATDQALIDEIRKHNRDRRTIRALVVAARAINCTLAEEMARDLSLIDLLGKDGPARLAERRKNRTARIKSNYWPMPECLKRDMDRNLRARGVDLDTFHAKITAITSKPPQAKE